MPDGLDVEVRDHVGWVRINRPERRNAMSLGLMRALTDAFSDLEGSDDVRVIALTGTGTAAFCSGADLKEMDERSRQGLAPPTPMTGPYRNVFESVLDVGKPTVAVLNGPAVGAGVEISLACDVRIAADHASLTLPEVKRGLGAHFGSVMLQRLVPRAVAFEMLYTGETMSAAEAHRWGLVNRLVPSALLPEEAERLLSSIAANAPLTLRRYKQVMSRTWSLPVAAALRTDVGPDVYGSRDREEGVRAYLEKREPRWEGR